MAIYTIGDLEKLSGIKTHTIRIWEQRYGLLEPRRTSTKQRYYEDEELQLLLHVAFLNRQGYKISKIAAMTPEQIREKVEEITRMQLEADSRINVLTLAFVEMDEYRFSNIFDAYVKELGLEETFLQVIYPFLEKLSLMWLSGAVKPCQENFFTLALRSKLHHAIESCPLPSPRDALRFMLFMPQGESDELSLLLVQYMIRSRGMLPIFIGSDTGLMDVEDAHKIIKPHFVFTILSESFNADSIEHYVERLAAVTPGARLLLTGYHLNQRDVALPHGASVISNLDSLRRFLDEVRSE